MPSRKRQACTKPSTPTSKSLRTGELLSTGVTKSALVTIIRSLHDSGHMSNSGLTRRNVQRRVEEHAEMETPYGRVVQTISVGSYNLEYIHQSAPLYHLCSISAGFRTAMEHAQSVAVNNVSRVVLYSDAATPGNVFRPDKGKKFEAFYWSSDNRIILSVSYVGTCIM